MEGCGYRDLYEDFQALGVEIVGISFDPAAENAAWAEEEGFQYELWSDVERTLGLYYGAAESPEDDRAARLSFLLDKQGAVLLEYDVGIGFGAHPQELLEDCRVLFDE